MFHSIVNTRIHCLCEWNNNISPFFTPNLKISNEAGCLLATRLYKSFAHDDGCYANLRLHKSGRTLLTFFLLVREQSILSCNAYWVIKLYAHADPYPNAPTTTPPPPPIHSEQRWAIEKHTPFTTYCTITYACSTHSHPLKYFVPYNNPQVCI